MRTETFHFPGFDGHPLAALLDTPDTTPRAYVATIGAPSEPLHIAHPFADHLHELSDKGEAEVNIGGRKFRIRQQFLDAISGFSLRDRVRQLHCALLVMHSPVDAVVEIEQARQLYEAARHPKSFVSLDDADHILRKPRDATYVAEVLVAWAERYLPELG